MSYAKGATRLTVETLAAGQPRPYADTIHHVRVTFEHVPWDSKTGDFEPWFLSEAAVIERLKIAQCGFTNKRRSDPDYDWFDTRLDWLRPVDKRLASELIKGGSPTQVLGSVWEFHTTSEYTG